jgi:rsbT co-antagonist protein RsbR
VNPSNINETLVKFEIGDHEIQTVRASASLLKKDVDAHIDRFYDWMSQHKEYRFFFASNLPRLERVKAMQRRHWLTLFDAVLDEEWFLARKHVGAVHAHMDVPNDIYFAGMSVSGKSLVDQVTAADSGYPNPYETASALMKLVFLDAYVVIDEITRIQREKISAGNKALMEMSTPVTPIWDGILLLPLVGILDSARSQDVMTKTLNKIAETRARVFVLDISGVGAMDTAVANQLLKITKATQLMGCETIVSGLSPAIASTLVELGVNVGEVRTTATLRDSFELALRTVGADRKMFSAQS